MLSTTIRATPVASQALLVTVYQVSPVANPRIRNGTLDASRMIPAVMGAG
jgi:hypothetical protein